MNAAIDTRVVHTDNLTPMFQTPFSETPFCLACETSVAFFFLSPLTKRPLRALFSSSGWLTQAFTIFLKGCCVSCKFRGMFLMQSDWINWDGNLKKSVYLGLSCWVYSQSTEVLLVLKGLKCEVIAVTWKVFMKYCPIGFGHRWHKLIQLSEIDGLSLLVAN